LIDYNNVAGLIPHSGKMALLDRIVKLDDDSLIAETTARNDGLFGDASDVPAWVGIEYMAQAVGAYAGIKSKLAGKPIKLGYLLGTRRYNSNVGSFPFGTSLTIEVKIIIQDDKIGVFDCKILGEGIEITANISVYQPPAEASFEKRT
jgi:predicted hotdog family 3-hydroxylacyl-ACP dehydratase